jgi:hypothetical protein
MDAYEENAVIYCTFLCDNFGDCHGELCEHPTIETTDERWFYEMGKLAKESGWLVERIGGSPATDDWKVLCPSCRGQN